MPADLMVSMLRKGNTGDEILAILDALMSENVDANDKEPTLDEIQF
jgi:hypothetical protein